MKTTGMFLEFLPKYCDQEYSYPNIERSKKVDLDNRSMLSTILMSLIYMIINNNSLILHSLETFITDT